MEQKIIEDLTCPITLELFEDPITVPCCGKTFSRNPLHLYLSNKQDKKCPLCNGDLTNFDASAVQTNKNLLSFVELIKNQQISKMLSICDWLFVLGLSHLSIFFVLRPPVYAPFTKLPLPYFGELANMFTVISLHIYMIWRLVKLNVYTDATSSLIIQKNHFLLFCVALFLTCYGYAYHNITAVADLLVNFGQSTSTISYGGNFLHYFHEFVSHKIQYSGIFVFYILILNLSESKLLLINKSNADSKYSKVIKQFLDTKFGKKHIIMALMHGILTSTLFSAVDIEIFVIIFCIIIIYKCKTVSYKSAAHEYMELMSIEIIFMTFTLLRFDSFRSFYCILWS